MRFVESHGARPASHPHTLAPEALIAIFGALIAIPGRLVESSKNELCVKIESSKNELCVKIESSKNELCVKFETVTKNLEAQVNAVLAPTQPQP